MKTYKPYHYHLLHFRKQEAFEKCWAHSPRKPPHAHSAGVATGTVARRLRIDVHNDNNDNAWQRGPLWPHGMGPKISNMDTLWAQHMRGILCKYILTEQIRTNKYATATCFDDCSSLAVQLMVLSTRYTVALFLQSICLSLLSLGLWEGYSASEASFPT